MNALELKISKLSTTQLKEIIVVFFRQRTTASIKCYMACYNELEKRLGEDEMDVFTDSFYFA